jgi:hypothetical protein
MTSNKEEYTKKWKKEHRDKVNETHKKWLILHPNYRKNRRAKRIEQLNELKNKPCVDCGGIFPSVAMDFDHIKGEKYKTISSMINSSDSVWSEIIEEIKKCELVCANCHRVRTYNRGDSINYKYRKEVNPNEYG